MTTQHATSLLPLFSDWKGASSPRVTLLSRNGQVMGIDLFDSSTNYNAVIAAQSGSGKSFFANDLIYAYLAAGVVTMAWTTLLPGGLGPQNGETLEGPDPLDGAP